jgi:xylulokinase
VEEGIVVNSMGSTDSLNATYSGVKTGAAMLDNHFTCTPAAVPGLYCTNAFSLGGGNLLTWFRDHLDRERAQSLASGGESYFAVLVAEAMKSRNPVLVLPHFAGSGTPRMDPESRGAMLGLSLASQKKDIARGIFEGIALEMALNLEALKQADVPLRSLYAGSGGSRNPELVQMRADVFNLPVTPLNVEEAGCLACAMLALCALDPSRSIRQLARTWIKTGEPVMPRPQQAEVFARKREIYARLYPALRELNRRAGEFQDS